MDEIFIHESIMLAAEKKVRSMVQLILEQDSNLRLDRELIKVTVRLIMDNQAHVPDTLTRIRVLPSVAVVGQKSPVERTQKGSTFLEIYVKFLPNTGDDYKNLKSLGKLIKTLPGIKIVRVISVGGRPVIYKGKPIVI
jgi:hypothetical protein